MTDLTDSYCERCGARYVFSPPAPKTMSLKGARLLAKGLKNFVMTDGQSMADSLTLARHEDGHLDSARITEAFHRTFNFCMTCRQYACEKCWNVRAGACLSCSPEEGFEPLAREEHLLVRTPVARWDMDWSLFPDGPEAEPVTKPLPFDPPIRFSDSPIADVAEPAEVELARSAAPAGPDASPEPAAWPEIDLPTPEQTGVPARGEAAAHRTANRAVDPMAASLWPMADELSPEMTLTPEELELVETRLSHGEERPEDVAAEATEPGAEASIQFTSEPAPLQAVAPEPAAAKVMAPEPAPEPAPAPVVAPEPEPMFRRVEPAAPAWPPGPVQTPAPSTESAPTAPVWPAAPQFPAALVPPASAAPQFPAAPVPPALVPPASAAVPPASSAPLPVSWRSSGHTVDNSSPWPHVTAWSERPAEVRDRNADIPRDAAPGEGAPAEPPVVPVFEQAPAPGSTPPAPAVRAATPSMPPARQIHLPVPDARSAAAMRLSAVPPSEVEPAEFPLAAAPAQPEYVAPPQPELVAPVQPQVEPPVQPQYAAPSAAQPAAQAPVPIQAESQPAPWLPPPGGPRPKPQPPVRPQLFEMPEFHQTLPQAARAPELEPVERRAPAAPWQPLGPSWAAGQRVDTPWPAPQVPPGLPAVAAQQAGAATVTAMWAQSSQEVLNHGTVRVCHRCALPVSTHARFCRRCGTQQT